MSVGKILMRVSCFFIVLLLVSCSLEKTPVSISNTNNNDSYQYVETQKQSPLPKSQRNLVAYWPFDEESGTTVIDASGNGHDGIMVGLAQRTTGVIGNALLNLGNNGGVNVPDDSGFVLTGHFTIMAWLRIDKWPTYPTQSVILFRGDSRANYDPYVLAIDINKTILFHIHDSASVPAGGNHATVSAPADSGVWFHVTAVYNTTGCDKFLALHINGQMVSRVTTTVTPMSYLNSSYLPGVGIGHHPYRPNQFSSIEYTFNGAIDEVKIFSMGLSQREIEREAQRHRTRF
ncbi:LamG domain-containing protein [candidate division TA06 bacterium]|nr:LamG domain-containing protein [candidate division TA06 bacterium]